MSNSHDTPKPLVKIALSAIGVVFGDIGTSPLYAIKEVFHGHMPIDEPHVLGVLSLVFWSLTLVVTLKYAIFLMRADNKGEGGIMALMALTLHSARDNPKRQAMIVTLGLLGAALFYGDSIITPAISVLSAVEGLRIIAPPLERYVLPITIGVLFFFFVLQKKGTGHVGKLFSPIMCLWFATLGFLGISNAIENPTVFMAINPYYAVHLLLELGWQGFVIMGAVVLTITGAEALYADMGHFGLKPIRYAWFGFVFPALLCNYFGQGALLLQNPGAIENPFYLLAPSWALYPLLLLATFATVIASQAVISGAFSITRQAIQLGYCPRMTIQHTSGDEMGQVYVPTVNWLIMVAVFILVLSFASSSALASAYGIAVTGTMMVDTILAYFIMRSLWRWPGFYCLLFLSGFLVLDGIFFSSNCLKIFAGGWLPLLVGLVLFLIMTTWLKGRELVSNYWRDRRVLFEDLEDHFKHHQLATVSGTAIYLTRNLHGVPLVLLHNLEHNHVLHEKIIVLTIAITDEPYVEEARRLKVRTFGRDHQFYRVKLYFGFKQSPDVRRTLVLIQQEGVDFDPQTASFFVGREQLSFKAKSKFPQWRQKLFQFLFHNSSSAIGFFKIPVERVIEVGVRLEL